MAHSPDAIWFGVTVNETLKGTLVGVSVGVGVAVGCGVEVFVGRAVGDDVMVGSGVRVAVAVGVAQISSNARSGGRAPLLPMVPDPHAQPSTSPSWTR